MASKVEEEQKRIMAILNVEEEEDAWVAHENTKRFLDYLKDNLEFPCLLTGMEDFSWEERYVFGYGDKGEYEELKGAFESAKEDFTARIEALEAFKTEYDADKTSIEERITAVTEKMSGFDAKLEEMNAEPAEEENPLEEKVDKLTETVENLRTHLSPSFKTPEVLDEEETESTSLEVNPIIG